MVDNNFINDIFKAQMNLMNNWSEMSRKATSLFTDSPQKDAEQQKKEEPSITDPWKKMSDMYFSSLSDWMSKASSSPFMNQFPSFFGPKSNAEQFTQMPQQMMKQWFDMMQTFTPKMKPQFPDLLDWGSTTASVQKLYEQWLETMGTTTKTIQDTFSGAVNKDSLSNIFDSVDTYTKLFEVWAPFYKKMAEGQADPEKLGKFFSPEMYRDVVEQTFAFLQPSAIHSFYQEILSVFETLLAGSSESVQQLGQLFRDQQKKIATISLGNPDSIREFYTTLASQYRTALAPYLSTSTDKHAEQTRRFLNILDVYGEYAATSSEYQQKLYKTSLKAMEEVMSTIGDKVASGSFPKSYDEFFKFWAQVNEKYFLEMMSGEDYAKLQGKMGKSSMKVKIEFDRLIESAFEHLPLARRSEVDELHKTIHELKTRIRELEKNKIQ